ncbi:hypothetical protein ACVWZX_001263 [Deinococcus sp. UYEF24]
MLWPDRVCHMISEPLGWAFRLVYVAAWSGFLL